VDTQTDLHEQMKVRLDKVPQLKEAGYHPYLERFERTHRLSEASKLPDGTKDVKVAGRIIALRYFGKLAFGHLYDIDGKIQFSVQKKTRWANSLRI
jgi:lysyl-tRNA synthetase class 2